MRRLLAEDGDGDPASLQRHHLAVALVLLGEQRRYRDAIERWQRVLELSPTSDYAKRARREIRTASDLQRVFGMRGAA